MTDDTPRTLASASKDAVRKLVPNFLLQQRGIVNRLGPRAGRIYAGLRLRDVVGVRTENQRRAPRSARSFVFVCFGNIMRSAMAESLLRKAAREAGVEAQIEIVSAGLHAFPGREAHPWVQEVAADLGISVADHRSKLLTTQMVARADCIFAMDFQNKAELLTLYPAAQEKIYMLSAYAEGPWRYREIPDPYLGDLAATRYCGEQLQICVRNLMAPALPFLQNSEQQQDAGR